jgi:hypothetical protein
VHQKDEFAATNQLSYGRKTFYYSTTQLLNYSTTQLLNKTIVIDLSLIVNRFPKLFLYNSAHNFVNARVNFQNSGHDVVSDPVTSVFGVPIAGIIMPIDTVSLTPFSQTLFGVEQEGSDDLIALMGDYFGSAVTHAPDVGFHTVIQMMRSHHRQIQSVKFLISLLAPEPFPTDCSSFKTIVNLTDQHGDLMLCAVFGHHSLSQCAILSTVMYENHCDIVTSAQKIQGGHAVHTAAASHIDFSRNLTQ